MSAGGGVPLPSSTCAPSTYAIGDLHGEVTLLRRLLAQLPLREEDTAVFLGDYVDRGEDSAATVAAVREFARQHGACVFLRGNHEDDWLEQWDGVRFRRPATIVGAMETLLDFDEDVPPDVGHWMRSTLIDYEDEHAIYVHAGLVPGVSASRTPEHYKLWGHDGFLASTYDWGKPVVFGHWQLREPLLQPNKIGVDTGAFRTGILTAVRLPDRAVFQAFR